MTLYYFKVIKMNRKTDIEVEASTRHNLKINLIPQGKKEDGSGTE